MWLLRPLPSFKSEQSSSNSPESMADNDPKVCQNIIANVIGILRVTILINNIEISIGLA